MEIMPSYLLLRNNKQIGPFSREQLLQLGLKPYDLVWLEGKSAAWRYPGELPELKDHAPIVEEQPYDRFYKKQTTEQKKEPEPEITDIKNVDEKPEEEKYEAYMPKKTVSIIMPNKESTIKKEESIFVPDPAPAATQTSLEVETKYSQPLDEIKEMYVKQLQQRKYKTAQKKFMTQSLKKAAIFIAIIGSGVLIGFVIKPKNSVKKDIVNTAPQNIIPTNTGVSVSEETGQTTDGNTDAAVIAKINEQLKNYNEVSGNKPEPDPLTIAGKQNNVVEKKKLIEEENELPINQPNSVKIENEERNKIARNGNPENETNVKSATVTEEISKLVSVKSNNYKLKAFGGFENLELTVTNNSKFILDNVVVELQYMKINDRPAKIESIRFQSISPGGSLTVKIPDNNRGAKLIYKIVKIEPGNTISNTAGL